jgi:hypothetical protein
MVIKIFRQLNKSIHNMPVGAGNSFLTGTAANPPLPFFLSFDAAPASHLYPYHLLFFFLSFDAISHSTASALSFCGGANDDVVPSWSLALQMSVAHRVVHIIAHRTV